MTSGHASKYSFNSFVKSRLYDVSKTSIVAQLEGILQKKLQNVTKSCPYAVKKTSTESQLDAILQKKNN